MIHLWSFLILGVVFYSTSSALSFPSSKHHKSKSENFDFDVVSASHFNDLKHFDTPSNSHSTRFHDSNTIPSLQNQTDANPLHAKDLSFALFKEDVQHEHEYRQEIFTGIPLITAEGINITRLSLSLYNYVRQNKVKSLADFGCHENVLWMPNLIQRLQEDIPGFKFFCVEDTGHTTHEKFSSNHPGLLHELHSAYSKFPDLNIFDFEWNNPHSEFPRADLYFSWRGFHEVGLESAWNILKHMRRNQVRYLVIGNNRGVDNVMDIRIPVLHINLLRKPFYLHTPGKVISDITPYGKSFGPHGQQLFFYHVDELRPGVL